MQKKFREWKALINNLIKSPRYEFGVNIDDVIEAHQSKLEVFNQILERVCLPNLEDKIRKRIFELDLRTIWPIDKYRPFLINLGNNRDILNNLASSSPQFAKYFCDLSDIQSNSKEDLIKFLKNTNILEELKMFMIKCNNGHVSIVSDHATGRARCGYISCRGDISARKEIFHCYSEVYNLFNQPGKIVELFLFRILEQEFGASFSVEYDVPVRRLARKFFKRLNVVKDSWGIWTDFDVIVYQPPNNIKLVILTSINPSSGDVNRTMGVCRTLRYKTLFVTTKSRNSMSNIDLKDEDKFEDIHKIDQVRKLKTRINVILGK